MMYLFLPSTTVSWTQKWILAWTENVLKGIHSSEWEARSGLPDCCWHLTSQGTTPKSCILKVRQSPIAFSLYLQPLIPRLPQSSHGKCVAKQSKWTPRLLTGQLERESFMKPDSTMEITEEQTCETSPTAIHNLNQHYHQNTRKAF